MPRAGKPAISGDAPACIDNRSTLVYQSPMSAEPCRSVRSLSPRWLSGFLLLTILFLPLHFHSASAAVSQVTKECACLNGSRTEAGVAAVPEAHTRLAVIGEVAPVVQVKSGSLSIYIPSSRAPPFSVSR